MEFFEFDKNRAKMENQYAIFYNNADKERAKNLYEQTKNISESEKSQVVGFGKAVKHFFKNVELYVNPADIFADIANEDMCPVHLRNEEYQKYVKPNESSVIQAEGAFSPEPISVIRCPIGAMYLNTA